MTPMLNPEVGATVAVIRSLIPQLGPGERRVAEEIVADPVRASVSGASELGARCGTSAATVVRASKSMGFEGYQALRTLLVRDAGAAEAAARGGAPAAGEGTVRRMFAEAARELDQAPAAIDLDAFDRVTRTVAGARRVVLLGSGSSTATVHAAAIRFLSVGILVEHPGEPTFQVLTCRLLTEGDVVVAVSDSGENSATLAAAEAARAAGAQIVAVTTYPGSTLAQAAHEQLVVGSTNRPWPDSVLTSTMLQTSLLNALVVEVAARRERADDPGAVAEDVLRAVTGNRRPRVPGPAS